MSAASFTLTVAGVDKSPFVRPGASFSEVASTPSGQATFTLNGLHPEVVNGASIVLERNGSILWEGTVQSATQQIDAKGNTVAMPVMGLTLASQLDQAITYVVTTPVDISEIASSLCALGPIPYGGTQNVGQAVGSLNFYNLATGLRTLATMARKTWRVQNGQVVFVDTTGGVTQFPTTIVPSSIAGQQVVVRGGYDASAMKVLHNSYLTVGSSSGPTYHMAYPEISDSSTLDLVGAVLAEEYGSSGITASLALTPGYVNRAGDWIVDQAGTSAVVWVSQYTLTQGDLVPVYTLGYPQLPTTLPVVPDSVMRRFHDQRSMVHGDYVSGSGSGSGVGWGASRFGLKGWGL